MTIDPALIVSVLVAVLTGGTVGAFLTHLREQGKADHETLGLFYKTWSQETERLHAKIDHLEVMVVALSDELVELGGDPLRIRKCLRPKPTPTTEETKP